MLTVREIMETGAIMLTKSEFCSKTRIKPNDPIFNDSCKNPLFPRFFMYEAVHNSAVNEPEKYFFNNGKRIFEFKHHVCRLRHNNIHGLAFRVFDMTVDTPMWTSWRGWTIWKYKKTDI